MAFGFGVLRLPPDDFWQMTPRELASAIEGLGGNRRSSLLRDQFEALMRAFPDQPHDRQDICNE